MLLNIVDFLNLKVVQDAPRYAGQPTIERTQAGLSDYGAGVRGLTGLSQLTPGGNPFVDRQVAAASRDVIDNFQENINPSIAGIFASAGRGGDDSHIAEIGRQARGVDRTLGDISANIRGRAYESDRNRQLAASGQLGQLGLSRFEGESGRILDRYKTDTDAGLRRYGIDADIYKSDAQRELDKYRTDAGIGADLYKADLGGALSKYGTDVTAGLADRDLRARLSQDRFGLDRELALRKYGIDADLYGTNLDDRFRYANLGVEDRLRSRGLDTDLFRGAWRLRLK